MSHLITRPQPEADELHKQLADRGVRSVVCPLSEIAFSPPAKLPVASYEAVIGTSVNGVRGLKKIIGKMKREEIAQLFSLPFYAVGEATAAAARQLGFSTIHLGTEPNSAALVRLIKENRTSNLLYLAGTPRRAEISQAFPQAQVLELYRTTFCQSLPDSIWQGLERRDITSASFFSAGAASVFASFNPPCHLKAFCLSAEIAAKLPAADFSAIVMEGGAPSDFIAHHLNGADNE